MSDALTAQLEYLEARSPFYRARIQGRRGLAQIPFTTMAGFTTDHVLVRAAQADLAVAVLSGAPPPPQRPGTNP